ncbi:MAG: cytidine deaminase [bacterium]|nr:cytidine deaminase [bacterium]
MNEKKMIDIAREVLNNAYAPYSKYRVGAVVETSSGNFYTGCNVENMSFGLTVCAERVAIFKAISNGEKSITRVVIISDDDSIPIPCGACLQVMSEFSDRDLEVIVSSRDGKLERFKLADLLPNPFKFNKEE